MYLCYDVRSNILYIQFSSSYLDFIGRLLAHEGITYMHRFGDDRALVLTDSVDALPLASDQPLRVVSEVGPPAPPSADKEESLSGLTRTCRLMATQAQVADYDYRKPMPGEVAAISAGVKTEAVAEHVNNPFIPETYVFGDHQRTSGQARHYATVRSEALVAAAEQYDGQGDHRAFRAGHRFRLAAGDGGAGADADEYVITSIQHAATQEFRIGRGSGSDDAQGGEAQNMYRNRFIAASVKAPLRPLAVLSARPVVSGLINARIDGASGDQYAELDDQGRYRVKLLLDRGPEKDGKASMPVRMVQPYAGGSADNPSYGLHLPLHKGTEVLLAHVNGDPDRPVIVGAVPNPATPSPVSDANQTQARLVTAGKNELTFEDEQGQEDILLKATKDHHAVIANDEQRYVGRAQLTTVGIDAAAIDAVVKDASQTKHASGGALDADAIRGKTEVIVPGYLLTVGGVFQTVVGGAMNVSVAGVKAQQVLGAEFAYTKGNRQANIDGDDELTVKGEHKELAEKDRTITAKKKMAIQVEDELSITVGKASITMKKDGSIVIKGGKITIEGDQDVVIKGSKIKEN